jgi:hypothetical protein
VKRRRSAIHVSAYDDLGRVLVAGLEVLHMCDRRAAIKAVRSLLPIESDVGDLIEGLKSVGAIAFARDLEQHCAKVTRTKRRW